ncbi:unnamed protein product [Peronospora farinosa]|uniref:Uncharacterized protein n=1 Tax=Peronospora farinosa TaxID=134698 RepID=A0ABN8C641_9STRA|nr:unnamed protein product [Peronospora farinosa]
MLKLDQQTEHTLFIKLLTMWVKYPKNNDLKMRFELVNYDDITRLRILKGLSEIEGTEEVVTPLLNSMVTSWKMDGLSANDLFTRLQLDKGGNKFYFDMWVRYVVQEFDTLQHHGDESLLKIFDTLAKAKVGKDLQGELKSALITSWKAKKKSPREVLELLKLNLKPEPNHSVDVELLSMWVQYVKENSLTSGV